MQERIVAGVDYHLVSKVPDVLNRVTRSRILVESWSCDTLGSTRQGLGCRGFFNSPASLAIIVFCSGIRRIGLVVGVVFVKDDVDLGLFEFMMGHWFRPLRFQAHFPAVSAIGLYGG